MKIIRHFFPGISIFLMLCGMFMSAFADGATPLDWDYYMSSPEYTTNASGQWFDLYFRDDGKADISRLHDGFWSETDPTMTLSAYRNWQKVAEQQVVPSVASMTPPKEVFTALQKYNYKTDHATEGVFANSWNYARGNYDKVFNEDRAESHVHWYVDSDFIIYIMGFDNTDDLSLRCINTIESKGSLSPYDKSLQEEIDNWKSGSYVVEGSDSMEEQNGRFIFRRVIDFSDPDSNYQDKEVRKTSYRHLEKYMVLDILPEVPGLFSISKVDIDISYSYVQGLKGTPRSDGVEIERIFHSAKDTMMETILPAFLKLRPTFTWQKADVSEEPRYSKVQTATQTAPNDPGEESETTIWNNIVEGISSLTGGITGSNGDGSLSTAEKIGVSLGGALATAGALSAANGGKNEGDKENEKKKKTYKMKVYKGFGDAIRKGDEPVSVWARIVEIEEGEENVRDDLTANISASGEGMNVRLIGMQNSWQGAEVSIPKDSEAQTATLIFTFTGKGGVMHNRISFRVIGDPEIVFPRDNEDGTVWELRSGKVKAWMVAGKGGSDKVRFHIRNIMEEPKKISFRTSQALKVTYEEDPKFAYTYHACIENQTALIDKKNGVFADLRYEDVTIDALFEDGSVVSTVFSVELYPDGLSISAGGQFIQDDRLVIDTVQKENVSPGYSPFVPTVFYITVAYLNEEGRAVILENPGFTYKEPTDDGKYGLLFDFNFFYHIKHNSTTGIWFWPENTLPSLGDPYDAHMQIMIDDEDSDRPYTADIPLAVLGEAPKPAYSDEERAEALRLLKKDIKIFGLGNNKQLKTAVKLAMSGQCSYDEIKNIRIAVIKAGVAFYRVERDAYKDFGNLMSNYIVIAGTLVKAGDFAIDYLLRKLLGGYGGPAAKIINPLKNLLATYIGNIYEYGNLDKAPDFIDTLLKSCDEALMSAITGVMLGDDGLKGDTYVPYKAFGKKLAVTGNAFEEIKNTLGYVIAVYLMLRFVQHYNGKTDDKASKGDVFRSMVAAIYDLGYEAIKAFIWDRIAKGAASLTEKLIKWAGQIFKMFCQEKINEAVLKAGEQAFGEKIKQDLREKGIISYAGYRAAKTAKALAKRDTFMAETRKFDTSKAAKITAEGVRRVGESKWIGTILAFMLGKREPDEGYGVTSATSTNDFIADNTDKYLKEFIEKYLSVKPGEVYAAGISTVNFLSVTFRMEKGKVILGLLGYSVEILMTGENFAAIAGMLFESLFSWLDAYWEMMKNTITVPDPREHVEKNVEIIREELEEQKKRFESLEDVEFKSNHSEVWDKGTDAVTDLTKGNGFEDYKWDFDGSDGDTN